MKTGGRDRVSPEPQWPDKLTYKVSKRSCFEQEVRQGLTLEVALWLLYLNHGMYMYTHIHKYTHTLTHIHISIVSPLHLCMKLPSFSLAVLPSHLLRKSLLSPGLWNSHSPGYLQLWYPLPFPLVLNTYFCIVVYPESHSKFLSEKGCKRYKCTLTCKECYQAFSLFFFSLLISGAR